MSSTDSGVEVMITRLSYFYHTKVICGGNRVVKKGMKNRKRKLGRTQREPRTRTPPFLTIFGQVSDLDL